MDFTIVNDTSWLDKLLKPSHNPEFELRLRQAYSHPLCSSNNENIKQTLRNLRTLGLVVEVETTGFAHSIANSLLNYPSTNSKPCPCRFELQIGPDPNSKLAVPSRSHLNLYLLSVRLQIDIYLFSTRSKAISFRQPGATSSIAFLHRVDSYININEYLVLIPSKTSIAVTNSIPLPPASRYVSEIPIATFREQRRTRIKRARDDDNALAKEECLEHLKRAW